MKRGTPRHPKMKHLSRALGVEIPYAVGIMEMLWHFTAEMCPRGNVGRFTDADIAEEVGWSKDPELLISALVLCGWLDVSAEHRLTVHDWKDHADQAVERKLKRSGDKFIENTEVAGMTSQRLDMASLARGSGSGSGSLNLFQATEKTGEEKTETGVSNTTRAREKKNPAALVEISPKIAPAPEISTNSQAFQQPPHKPPILVQRIRSSDSFHTFWKRYSKLRDGARQDASCHAWLSYDCDQHATEILLSLASYEESRDVERGTVMNCDTWLQAVFENGWTVQWPKAGKRQQRLESAWA